MNEPGEEKKEEVSGKWQSTFRAREKKPTDEMIHNDAELVFGLLMGRKTKQEQERG